MNLPIKRSDIVCLKLHPQCQPYHERHHVICTETISGFSKVAGISPLAEPVTIGGSFTGLSRGVDSILVKSRAETAHQI